MWEGVTAAKIPWHFSQQSTVDRESSGEGGGFPVSELPPQISVGMTPSRARPIPPDDTRR